MPCVWCIGYPHDGSEPIEYGYPLEEQLWRIHQDAKHFHIIEIIGIEY